MLTLDPSNWATPVSINICLVEPQYTMIIYHNDKAYWNPQEILYNLIIVYHHKLLDFTYFTFISRLNSFITRGVSLIINPELTNQ